MAEIELSGAVVVGSRRRRRSVEERRRIVEETLERGASVARVARKYGVNANQVFGWRKLYERGRLSTLVEPALKLLPVSVTEDVASGISAPVNSSCCGVIHIELPGRALVSVEGTIDAAVIRAVLKSLLP
jgi:transposase